jgi:hypothetical protein
MSLLNESQISLRTAATNFPTLQSFLNSYVVRVGPLSNTLKFTLGASALFTPLGLTTLNATLLAVGLAPGSASANGGLTVAQMAGGTGTASAVTMVDSLGNILNMVPILNSVTNEVYEDPTNGDTVYGLMHVANTTTDGTAVGAANVQLDFVTISPTNAITPYTLVAGTYKFRENRTYNRRQEPVIFLEGGNTDWEQIYTPPVVIRGYNYAVTTAYTALEVITLSTGVGATAGISTTTTVGSPVVTTIGASALAFNDNANLQFYLNGVLQLNGVDVTWVSSTTFTLALPLYIGDVVELRLT